MSKKLFMTLGLSCLLLVGCQTAQKTAPESSVLTPTGYASDEIQRLSLFYDGALYLYNATGFDLPKEESWELLGQVAFVNNLEFPTEDFYGTHLNVGQEIYWKPSEPQKLYVKYNSGFALFEAEENYLQDGAVYSVPADLGDLEVVKEFGNPKDVLEIIRNSGADTTNIKIDYGASSIYTKAEIDAANPILHG